MICGLETAARFRTGVVEWGSPIPYFGSVTTARIATVGLNPSNREFMDERGGELSGYLRRFHTLHSLGISEWSESDTRHFHLILESCNEYFLRNPYNSWFMRLEYLVSSIGASFYGLTPSACHLDLIPFATKRKWIELTGRQKSKLHMIAADSLGLLIRNSSINTIVLNGASVVDQFGAITGHQLYRELIPGASLRRHAGPSVSAYGVRGMISKWAGVPLDRQVTILGYNHNIQSSFGVSRNALCAIREWVSTAILENH